MRTFAAIVLAVWMSALFGQPAQAEKRVALVIGNSNYRNVNRLTNPSNDASRLAEVFKQAKFDVVTLLTDVPRAEMRKALRDFGDQARDADVAVVYYAGHGIEVDGTNYLIPVDAVLERDTDVYDEAFPLDRVLVAIEPARQLRLIILDACRDNPFAKTMKRTLASRGIGRGLAKVEPQSPNTMIAFAAKAGFTASDGDGKDSPFALALSDHLTTPGLDLRKAFGFVRDEVLKSTGNQQEPFIYGSLGGDDVALVPAPAVAAPAATADPNEAVRRDYELAERVGTREGWDSFLATYPDGFYAKLAQAQRNKLAAEEARVAATEKARAAAEEKARLAAEGAKAAEQAKAAADAKAAEQARIAAEKQKAIEDARVAAAERDKATAEAHAAALQKALEDAKETTKENAKENAKAAEAKPAAADKPVGQLAALTPPADKPDDTGKAPSDTPRLLLTELRRVGCFTGSIEGSWTEAAQRSLAAFNKHAGTTLDIKVASLDTLDVVRGKTARVCPLICDRGYKADGDTCTKVTCKAGYELDDNGDCIKVPSKKPEAKGKPDSRPEEQQPTATRTPGGDSNNPYLTKCGATSCSQAMNGCLKKLTIIGQDTSICAVKYNACLQTGAFTGRWCQLHGLARN